MLQQLHIGGCQNQTLVLRDIGLNGGSLIKLTKQNFEPRYINIIIGNVIVGPQDS